MPDKNDDKDLLDFAVGLAEESGGIALRYFRTPVPVTSKSTGKFDPVTEADRNIEQFLREKIHARYPEHGIRGEEHETLEGNTWTWVIDPIDGTRGFISGSPMWGTLLGLVHDQHPVLGVMHQPLLQETFFADTSGAWWKRPGGVQAITARATARLDEAILYCTHPSMFSTDEDIKVFRKLESRCQYSRYGGDCYGYSLLAAGFIDFVVEGNLQSYDIIPLIPIIESAGGIITDWSGGAADKGGKVIAAANKGLHRAAMDILNS